MRFRAISRFAIWLIAAAVLGLFSAQKANAQALYGQIAGTVTDQTGAVVPGASVTITNVGTGYTRHTTSGTSGLYRFTTLQPGTYTVSVTAKGFKPTKKTGIRLTAGEINQ